MATKMCIRDRIYDGDKRLCSLHLREGRLSFLVMFSASECEAVSARLDALSPAVRAYYEAAHVEDGVDVYKRQG